MKTNLLVFHTVVAPYRLDFFNRLSEAYDMNMMMFSDNTSQNLDYSTIERQLTFPFVYNIRSRSGFFRWVHNIVSYIRKIRPDIILTNEFGLSAFISLLYRILSRRHFRIVSIVDDSYNFVTGEHSFSLRHKLARICLMPFLDDVVNVEPQVTAYYQAHYGKGICMPIIVEEDNFRGRLSKALPLSVKYIEQYHLKGRRVLLYVGRLAKVKNIGLAIRAFREAKVDDSVFVIVGEGAERERLEELASGTDNILFLGQQLGEALYAWYNIAQVFILPSLVEPFGAVTNEALLAGCRAIVSNRAGSCFLVREGVNGSVLDPNDLNKTVSQIQRALSSCSPVSIPTDLRTNNMLESFNERMHAFLESLEKSN